jgi:TRAP-type C4-dicarboxylate transport system permease small subunit
MAPLKTENIPESVGNVLAIGGGIALTLMMVHIITDVTLKYLFNDPIDGTTEIVAAYYMVSTVFLPLAFVTVAKGHLFVELFTTRLSGRPLNLLSGITGLITLAYLLFLLYCTVDEAILRTIDGEAWETSVELVAVWPSRWLLPIGLGAMAFVIVGQTIRHFRDGFRPKAPTSHHV